MTDAAPADRTVKGLGERLRRAREKAGMSGTELASALGPGWRQSKISKIETGRQLPTVEDIEAWAQATGVDAEPLLALLGKASAQHRARRNRIAEAGGAAAFQDEISALLASCTFIAEYQPAFIPGILQMPAYVQAMAEGDVFSSEDGISADDIQQIIAAKLRRQSILYEPGRTIVHVIGEAALQTRIGTMSADVLKAQLEFLATTATLPNHQLCIVPLRAVLPIAPISGFFMYDQDLVVIESLTGDTQVTDPVLIKRYATWLAQLQEISVTGSEAAELCRATAKRM